MTYLMIVFPGLYPSRAGVADGQLGVSHVPRDPRPGRHLHSLKLCRSLDSIIFAHTIFASPSLPIVFPMHF